MKDSTDEHRVHLSKNHSLFVRINQITELLIQKNRIGLSLSPLSECANLPSIKCWGNEEMKQHFWREVEEFLQPDKSLCGLRCHCNRLRATSSCEMGIPELPHRPLITQCALYKSGLTASSCVTTRGLSVLCLCYHKGFGNLFGCSCSLLFLSPGLPGTKKHNKQINEKPALF